MCGIAGSLDLEGEGRVQPHVVAAMTARLRHRGPDSTGLHVGCGVGLGIQRLAIIDPVGGDQPMYNEDRSIAVVCNGEIFNYRALREDLRSRGHVLTTESDIEVLPHLYEEYGAGMLERINGQFALALHDARSGRLLLARDHFGILPLFHTVVGGELLFASEIKALLAHPRVSARVDLAGLDQVFVFPGLVSPRTMFEGIHSLRPGHYLSIQPPEIRDVEYWDLVYPERGARAPARSDREWFDELRDHLERSVRMRLRADVPVGFYLSGGLDSSLIASLVRAYAPSVERHSFSIGFTDASIDETHYQRLAARHVGSTHHELVFDVPDIIDGLELAVYHSECALKETYNTASLALSRAARAAGVPVVLTGEGSDELFAGYVGYRFDQRPPAAARYDLEAALEDEARARLWGDPSIVYEKDYHAFGELLRELYSPRVNEQLDATDGRAHRPVDPERLRGRDVVHQRSYLDFKLRLCDHLVADHGDRMAMASSVEARYPFLDIELVELATRIPPDLKIRNLSEKHIVKEAARGLVPAEIVDREKFGFVAPGSPALLQAGHEWVLDMLSPARIRRQGYFCPEAVEHLQRRYAERGFTLNLPFDSDLLIVVLTFGVLLDRFGLPDA